MFCLQRAGRAGRVQSGKAFRLVTEEDFKRLPVNAAPEMQRTAMAPVILQLKALGIHDVVHSQRRGSSHASEHIQWLH